MPARDAFFVRLRVAPRTQPGQTTAGLGFKITYDTFGTSTGHSLSRKKCKNFKNQKLEQLNFFFKILYFCRVADGGADDVDDSNPPSNAAGRCSPALNSRLCGRHATPSSQFLGIQIFLFLLIEFI